MTAASEMSEPSDEYVALATTLLDSLTDSETSTDTTLLQLQALFGPMLTSALQLVDKREVVRVSLPSDRYVYQVSGSSGKPYTLHLDFPIPTRSTPNHIQSGTAATEVDSNASNEANIPGQDADNEGKEMVVPVGEKRMRRDGLRRDARTIRRLYCPCPGFAYNSLAGDRSVLCKHLLAALIAWKTERAVKTEVALAGVVDLLGLRNTISENGDGSIIKDEP